MTTISQTNPVTATDLLHQVDDGYRYELVGGQLVRDAPAGSRHGAIALRLGHLLAVWALGCKAGVVLAAETGYKLHSAPDTVRAPDASFVSQDRIPDGGLPDGYFDGPPDVAVEVVSPNDKMIDVLDKVRDYLDCGVHQVWVVVPQNRTLTIHKALQDVTVLTDADTLVGDGPIDGLQLRVAEVFS